MAQHGPDNMPVDEHAKRSSDLVAARKQGRMASGASGRPSVRQGAESSRQGAAPLRQAQALSARPSESKASDAQAVRQVTRAHPRTLRQFVMQNLLYILSVMAVAAIVALVIVILAPAASDTIQSETAQEEVNRVSYDWMKLDRTNGRYAYVVDGEVKSRLGIDVSESQHEIDWDAVAADGIDFALVRVGYRGMTEGDVYADTQFEANFAGARRVGIDCGLYFFSQAITVDEAVEEADFVLSRLDGAPLQYPIAFDSEAAAAGVGTSRTHGLDNAAMTAIANAFCERVEAAGYRSLVYGNANDLARYDRSHLHNHWLWWAEYGMPAPTARIDIALWQYTNDGTVAGISTPVDMNIDLTGVTSKSP